MATVSTPRVRLVKCPNCRKLLAEPEDVQVYECGGCNTVLQAKNRRISENGASDSQWTDPARTGESHTLSEHKDSNNSGHETVLPSSGESSLEQDRERNLKKSVDFISEKLDDVKLSNQEQYVTDQSSEHAENEKNRFLTVTGGNSKSEANNETAALAKDFGNETGSSSALISSPDEIQDQSEIQGFHDSVHVVSEDKTQRGDVFMNKKTFVYDASESSCEGAEDQFPDMLVNHSTNTRLSVPDERPMKGKLPIHSDSEIHELTRSSSSVLFQDLHHGTKNGKWDGNRNQRRYGADGHRSQIPLYPRGTSFSGAYERGSPSDQSYDEFHSQIYHDISYGRHIGGVGQGRGWERDSKFTGMPFSGEAMGRRYQVGHSYFSSDKLHLHPGHSYSNSTYSSYPVSPQRNVDYGYYPGWSREVVSDVEEHHRHNSRYGPKKHDREKHQVAKHHVRPISHGAPFVVCYQCLKTLQLPVDFLIFKRRYHFLRCGACSNVLRFSLQGGTHLVPAVLDAQPNPVSYSDDAADERITSYNSSSSLIERSGLNSNQYQTNYSNPGETSDTSSQFKASKPEKMVSSGTEESRGSPLHRLMGYSSVSQVFKVFERPPSRSSSDHPPRDQMLNLNEPS